MLPVTCEGRGKGSRLLELKRGKGDDAGYENKLKGKWGRGRVKGNARNAQ